MACPPRWERHGRHLFSGIPGIIKANHLSPNTQSLTFTVADISQTLQAVTISEPDFAKARVQWVATAQLSALSKQAASELSVKLQLVSPHASYIMVDSHIQENADGLPTLLQVPQMQPHRSVSFDITENSQIMPSYDIPMAVDNMDNLMFMKCRPTMDRDIEKIARRIHRRLSRRFFEMDLPTSDKLLALDIPAEIILTLKEELQSLGITESTLVALWLSQKFTQLTLKLPKQVEQQNAMYQLDDETSAAFEEQINDWLYGRLAFVY
jgi:hypothetical protein